MVNSAPFVPPHILTLADMCWSKLCLSLLAWSNYGGIAAYRWLKSFRSVITCCSKAFVGLDYCHDNINTFASKTNEGSAAKLVQQFGKETVVLYNVYVPPILVMHWVCWLKCPETVWVSWGFQHQWGCLSWWLWLGFTRAKQIVTKPTMYVSMTCLMGIIFNLLVCALSLLGGCFFCVKGIHILFVNDATCRKKVTPASENKTCVETKVTLSYSIACLSLQCRNNNKITYTKQEMHIYTDVKINESTNKNKVKVTCSLYHLYVHERHKCTVMDRMIEPYWGSTGTHVHREVESLFQGKRPRSFHLVRKKGIQIHSEAKKLLFFFQNEKKAAKKAEMLQTL